MSTPPQTHPEPKTDSQKIDWLRLIRSRRVGPATFFRLRSEHGSARAALEALPQIAEAAGAKNYAPYPHKSAYDEYTLGKSMALKLLCFSEPEYPDLLRNIPNPPPLIWAMGNVDLLNRPAIAIVGARNASSLGTRMTRKLATDLGDAGFIVISGIARGIDAAAHQAALRTGTIAVQAGGVDVIYPQENTALHRDIADQGLRLSENALGLVPQARHFPQRNRIIAGLAQATIVVEGALRSGSLITARDTADLGRDVMAVPGNPLDPRAAGCNALIRDGATLIRTAQDVIDGMSPLSLTPKTSPPKTKPAQHQAPDQNQAPDQITRKILTFLSPVAIPEDNLIRDMEMSAEHLTPLLTTLELEGKIQRHPGGLLALTG